MNSIWHDQLIKSSVDEENCVQENQCNQCNRQQQ